MQTAVEFLLEQLEDYDSNISYCMSESIQKAKEMEKQQIIDAYDQDLYGGLSGKSKFNHGVHYFAETYGSKGDEIKKAKEMGLYDKIELANPNDNIFTSSQKELMTIERIKEIQSKTAYPNSISVQQALLQVWNECVTSFQTEISDEEIEKEANKYSDAYDCPSKIKLCKHDIKAAFINSIGWYREQLKNKQ